MAAAGPPPLSQDEIDQIINNLNKLAKPQDCAGKACATCDQQNNKTCKNFPSGIPDNIFNNK
jgi:hypothetical protein